MENQTSLSSFNEPIRIFDKHVFRAFFHIRLKEFLLWRLGSNHRYNLSKLWLYS